MKILYTFSSIAKLAGTERILVNKMNYFADKLDYKVYLVTYEQGKHPYSFPLSNKIEHIDFHLDFISYFKRNWFVRFIKFAFLKKEYQKRLTKTINIIKPDIIICTSYYDMEIHALSKIKSNSVKIIESHMAKTYTKNHTKENISFIINMYEKLISHFKDNDIKKFDRVVTLTQGDSSLWAPINKTCVIPNIINHLPAESSSCDNKNVLSIGRLCKQKGFDFLIDSWKIINDKHPDWNLTIIGDGEDYVKLQNKIVSLGLQKYITIKGTTPNIDQEYLSSSIYVLSSRYEGFALVLLEAMSYGLPCISFNCPFGPKEVINNGTNGYLIDDFDIYKFAEKIDFLIENEIIRKKMGKTAKENVKRFLPENIMPLWKKLFTELIEQKKSSPLQ